MYSSNMFFIHVIWVLILISIVLMVYCTWYSITKGHNVLQKRQKDDAMDFLKKSNPDMYSQVQDMPESLQFKAADDALKYMVKDHVQHHDDKRKHYRHEEFCTPRYKNGRKGRSSKKKAYYKD